MGLFFPHEQIWQYTFLCKTHIKIYTILQQSCHMKYTFSYIFTNYLPLVRNISMFFSPLMPSVWEGVLQCKLLSMVFRWKFYFTLCFCFVSFLSNPLWVHISRELRVLVMLITIYKFTLLSLNNKYEIIIYLYNIYLYIK